MIDKLDYLEPPCPLCGGKEFYDPDPDAPIGRIDVARILGKADEAFAKNDTAVAGRLLEFWRNEARSLKDTDGELSITNELVGYYRKVADKENGLAAIDRAIELLGITKQSETPSGATVLLNCATALKAFGAPDEAMPMYRRAEELYEANLDKSDPRFGGLYNNMALALADLNKYADAESAYCKALSVMEKAEHGEAECAITYINLAHLYEITGDAEKITECLFNAYALLNTDDLPHDGSFAFVLEKCAPSFGHFGYQFIQSELSALSKEIYERD